MRENPQLLSNSEQGTSPDDTHVKSTERNNLEERARVYAKLKAGSMDNGYWDRYWDAYYSYIVTGEFGDEALLLDADTLFMENMENVARTNPRAFFQLMSLLADLTGETESSDQKTLRIPEYGFFKYAEEREEIFLFSKAIAEHLHEKGIKNLVIVDRSSRPLYVGVREYWMAKYPNEKMPDIYFINPEGFKHWGNVTHEELDQIDAEGGDLNKIRLQDEILIEFREAYSKLMKGTKDPTMIFDTCIHSGNTLRAVVSAFNAQGFENLEVGSVNPSDQGSRVTTDFFITRKRPIKGCYPFDRDRMIEKTFDHVYSSRSNDELARAAGIQLRREIKKIMQERLEG